MISRDILVLNKRRWIDSGERLISRDMLVLGQNLLRKYSVGVARGATVCRLRAQDTGTTLANGSYSGRGGGVLV